MKSSINEVNTNLLIKELENKKIPILDHLDVCDALEVDPPTNNVCIRYSKSTIDRIIGANEFGQDWFLVYYTGMSLKELFLKFNSSLNKKPCFNYIFEALINQEGLVNWSNLKLEPGYYLLNFKNNFSGICWIEQDELINKFYNENQRCPEIIVIETIFSYFILSGGDMLLKDWYHIGSTYIKNLNSFLAIGGHSVGGLSALITEATEKKDNLGVVLLRNYDQEDDKNLLIN